MFPIMTQKLTIELFFFFLSKTKLSFDFLTFSSGAENIIESAFCDHARRNPDVDPDAKINLSLDR